MEEYIVFSFDSTHEAIKSEKALENCRLDGRLIPLPPEISAGCGLSLRIAVKDKVEAFNILKQAEVGISGIFKLRKEGIKRFVEKL